jgi:hypothetical protein
MSIHPDANVWGRVAMIHAQLGDFAASVRAQEHALQVQPGDAKLYEWAALLSERLGFPERAQQLRDRAPVYSYEDPTTTSKPALY